MYASREAKVDIGSYGSKFVKYIGTLSVLCQLAIFTAILYVYFVERLIRRKFQ